MNYQVLLCFLFTFQIGTEANLLSSTRLLNDQILYSCNFENDTCRMTLEAASSGFTWIRNSGSTLSETTGPDFDHTTYTANGYYMYTEATEFEPGQIAKLLLPSLAREPKGRICLTFWYHMYGEHIGTLRVSQNDSILWSLKFNQSYDWIQQNVTIKFPSAGSIIFVGVRGGYEIGQPYGDIAIDDIVIYDEPCEYDVTTEEATTTSLLTTVITSTAAVTSSEAPTTSKLTTQPVTNATQVAATTTRLPVTPFQINQTSDYNAKVTSSNISTTLNSTGNNVTTGTQSSAALSTDNSNFTTAVAESNITSYSYNVTKRVSPAAVAMTDLNSAMTTMRTDVESYNGTGLNATDSNFTSAPKYESLQSTSAMLIDSQASSSEKIWNLTEPNLILLLAFLGAFILILILVVSVLACCLCVTRRRYNVARSANVFNSNTTLDRDSLNDNQRVNRRKNDLDY